MTANVAAAVRLIAVTDDALVRGRDPLALLAAAVRGGATSVQIRLRHARPRDLAALVRAAIAALPVPVIVNDRADVAIATGAHGVHLGAADLPVARVRAISPPGFLIGASVGDADEAERAGLADYWGVGPWRATATKPEAGAALGPAGFSGIVQLAAGRPCVAIGGVRADDVPSVRGAGGTGVAVVSGIFGEPDVEAAARRYRGGW